MVVGLGIDLVDIRRIERLITDHGSKFLEKTFTPEEIKQSEKYSAEKVKSSFFAKRFAAKEAFGKALGTGMTENVRFLDISVLSLPTGKPILEISGKTKEYIKKTFDNIKIKIDLSLSDEYPMAQACVIISHSK